MIREANASDLSEIAVLADEKRRFYAQLQPRFWRIAENATESHASFLASVLDRRDAFLLVATDSVGGVIGFALALRRDPPPVYDPGGPTCLIDDFWVGVGGSWQEEGRKLLEECTKRGRTCWNASQVVVVCGREDLAKGSFLSRLGYTVASEWYVRPLGPGESTFGAGSVSP